MKGRTQKSNLKTQNCQRGVSLVEAMVAVALLGGGVLALVVAMSGGAMAVQENDALAEAQALVRAQMEYTKSYAYDTGASTYPAITPPEGYSVSVNVTAVAG